MLVLDASNRDMDLGADSDSEGPSHSEEIRMCLSCLFNPSLSLALGALYPCLQDTTDWAQAHEPPPNLFDRCSCPSITRTSYKASSPGLPHVLQLHPSEVVAGYVLTSAVKVVNVTDPSSTPDIRLQSEELLTNAGDCYSSFTYRSRDNTLILDAHSHFPVLNGNKSRMNIPGDHLRCPPASERKVQPSPNSYKGSGFSANFRHTNSTKLVNHR